MAPWPWQVADLHSVVGRQVVLASSATHASRLPALLHDLVEGIAEYCSYTGHPASWSAARLANVRTYIRSGKWSGDAFLSREVTSSDGLTASAAYGIGYMTIRRLVQRFGLQRTLEFWRQTEDLPYAIPD